MERSFAAEIRELPQIFSWIEAVLLPCSPSHVRKVKLVVEEAVVNIICHSQSSEISITIRKESNQFTEIAVRDKGLPFNPLKQVPSIDRTSILEARKVGGLGIFLMRQLVDTIQYQRKENANILTFTILDSSRKK